MGRDLVSSLGWSLLHLIWQGGILSLLVWMFIRVMRNNSAGLRTRIYATGIVAMILLPPLTLGLPEVLKSKLGERARIVFPIENANDVYKPIGSTAPSQDAVPERGGVNSASLTKKPLKLPGSMGMWIATLWATGVLLSAMVRTVLVFRLRSRLSISATSPGEKWQTAYEAALEVFPGLAVPHLRGSRLVDQPMVLAHGKPCIYVPVNDSEPLNLEDRALIMAHELAHIYRGDVIGQKLLGISETLLFFHPGAWWLSKKYQQEREHHCDELVAIRTRKPRALAKALMRLEEQRSLSPRGSLGAGSSLRDRIVKLKVGSRHLNPSRQLTLGLLGLVLSCITLASMAAKVPVSFHNTSRSNSDYRAEFASAMTGVDSVRTRYRNELSAALEARDVDWVFELACIDIGLAQGPNYEAGMAVFEQLREFLHFRYEDVFQAPGNADVMCGSLGWQGAFYPSSFNIDGVGSSTEESMMTYYKAIELDLGDSDEFNMERYRERVMDAPWFVQIDPQADPFLQVDIEPDGIVDLRFDGDEVSSGPGGSSDPWLMETDESADGTRKQWLIGPAGTDLRSAPRIWIYRDGPIFAFLMDTDGDGRGNLGRGACIP